MASFSLVIERENDEFFTKDGSMTPQKLELLRSLKYKIGRKAQNTHLDHRI
jgi:hypothetical protein